MARVVAYLTAFPAGVGIYALYLRYLGHKWVDID